MLGFSRHDWSEREPGLDEARSELARLVGRSRHRKLWVMAGALFVTLAAVGVASRRPVRHLGRAILRLTETDSITVDQAERPVWGRRELRGYVNEVAFSNARLLEVIEKHGLAGPKGESFDPTGAVEDMREDLEVEVEQPNVLSLLGPLDSPRTAQIIITYWSSDPDEAQAVAQDLARFAVENEATRRMEDAKERVRSETIAVEKAQADVARWRADLALLGAPRAGAAAQPEDGERERLRGLVTATQDRLKIAEKSLGETKFRLSAEREQLVMHVETLEPSPQSLPMPRGQKMVLTGFIALVGSLFLAMVVVGAFDTRVYRMEDVTRLGMTALGHLPGLPANSNQAAGRQPTSRTPRL